jgi:hypothetical protein
MPFRAISVPVVSSRPLTGIAPHGRRSFGLSHLGNPSSKWRRGDSLSPFQRCRSKSMREREASRPGEADSLEQAHATRDRLMAELERKLRKRGQNVLEIRKD